MTTLKLMTGFAVLGIALLVGCKEPEAVKNAPAKSPEASSSSNATNVEFAVAKPPAFSGEFNPAGLEVGAEKGQLAPEIEGEDLDGVAFKLSDYRGKVVMLDFYGDW